MSEYFRSLPPDQREAESVKYIVGLKVIPVSSGKFALFDSHYNFVEVVETLDPEFFRAKRKEQADKYIADNLRRSTPKPKKSGADLLKELGL